MIDSLLVMVIPKAKLVARKWMSAVHGKKTDSKRQNLKLNKLFTVRFSCKNSLHGRSRNFLAQAMKEPGVMKMKNFKKRCNYATEVKEKPKKVSKIKERKHQEEKSKIK